MTSERIGLPPTAQSQPPHEAMERAAEWFALLQSGVATDDDRHRWRLWLEAKKEHAAAWSLVERISRRFEPIKSSAVRQQAADVYRAAKANMARRRIVLGVATLAGSAAVGWASWRGIALPNVVLAWAADHGTAVGEIRELALPDGTKVWLNTATAFNVDYQPGLRRLHLLAGEILIETAADKHRPFVVDTRHGRMRALGTRFTARLEEADAFVAVYEGAVEIRTSATGTTALIPAGRQTRFTRDGVDALGPADPAREAWSRKILVAQDTPLSEVVKELQRYRYGYLSLAPELADLRVVGSYPINDTDRTLAMLARVVPIQVRQTLPWWTSIQPAPRSANSR